MKKFIGILFSILFIACFVVPVSAAEEKGITLSETSVLPGEEVTITLNGYDDITLESVVVEADGSTTGVVEYSSYYGYTPTSSQSGETITISVTVSYYDTSDGTTLITESYKDTFFVTAFCASFSDTSLTLYEKQITTVEIPTESFNFTPDSMTFTSSDTSVVEITDTDSGEITLKAKKSGTAKITMTLVCNGYTIKRTMKVTVVDSGFSKSYYTVAEGYTISTSLKGLTGGLDVESVEYSSENSSYVSIDSDGVIEGGEYGQIVRIYATVTLEDGSTIKYSSKAEVTDPSFSQSQYVIAKGESISLSLSGTCDHTKKSYTVSNTAYLKLSKTSTNTFYAKKNGKNITVTAIVDGKTIKTKVYVSNVRASQSMVAIVKGKTSTISLKGYSNKYSTDVTYSSANESVATVSKTGKIKGIKYGSTIIYANVDGKTINIYVTVGTKKGVGAFISARSALGCEYSQTKRMLSGYRDCSSMVWKAYRSVGITMGVSYNWAPTAATQAYYFKTHGKIIRNGTGGYKKLQVGDLIYYSYETNGRYKNITHVAMYVGNGYIIHASYKAGEVTYANYNSLKSHIVMIARPSK